MHCFKGIFLKVRGDREGEEDRRGPKKRGADPKPRVRGCGSNYPQWLSRRGRRTNEAPPPSRPQKRVGSLLRFLLSSSFVRSTLPEKRIESILLDSFATRPPSDIRGCRALSFLIPTEKYSACLNSLTWETDLIIYDDETKDTQTKGTRTISFLRLRQHRSRSSSFSSSPSPSSFSSYYNDVERYSPTNCRESSFFFLLFFLMQSNQSSSSDFIDLKKITRSDGKKKKWSLFASAILR